MTWQQTLGLIKTIPISTFRFKNDSERQEAWQKNKSAIMALQGKPLDIGKDSADLHRILKRDLWFDYFQRPEAFYEYDRHENLRGPYDKRTLFFIESTCCGVEYDADANQAPENATVYRNQKEYLIKNGLLNSHEKAILKAEKA